MKSCCAHPQNVLQLLEKSKPFSSVIETHKRSCECSLITYLWFPSSRHLFLHSNLIFLWFRSEICDPKPSILGYAKNEHICGRPLGLRFDKKTGNLYIADAYFGLMKVGPEGGLATSLSTEAEGVPFKFINDLDLDDEGNVYFTDSSTKYHRR